MKSGIIQNYLITKYAMRIFGFGDCYRLIGVPKPSRESKMTCDSGFTLIEMIVVVAIIGILTAASVFQINGMFISFDKRNAEMQVLQDMRLAQKTTVEQGCQGIFEVSVDQETYSFGCDYVPFSEEDPPVYDSVKFTRNLPTNIRISADSQIVFNSRGQAIDYDGNLDSRSITLTTVDGGSSETFNTGTLSPTGFFSYSN